MLRINLPDFCNLFLSPATNQQRGSDTMNCFDEIYETYYADVYRFLLRLCSFREDVAEELTQDSFYHAYLGFFRFREDSQLKTWLFGIAKKRYLIYLRKHKHLAVSIDDALPFLCYDEEETVVDVLYQKALIEDALKIIFSFKENMQYIFLERIYNGTAYAEIARQLNISENSAKVLYHRGKQLLRKTLKEEYGYELTL